VAKSKAKTKKKGWRDNAIVGYLRDTRAEMRKVHWPTRQEAENLTKIVLAVTISMALFLGLLDYLFSLELGGLVDGSAIAYGIVIVIAVASIVVLIILNRQSV
jgi:preprotein translocase subunit SecE